MIDKVKIWCELLKQCFQEALRKVLLTLKQCWYTVRDASNDKDPENYIQLIIINNKNSDTAISESAQIILAYEYIDAEL